MKHALLSIALFFFFAASVFSLQFTPTYQSRVDTVYSGLDEQFILTGVLADKAQLHTAFNHYTAINDSASDFNIFLKAVVGVWFSPTT